MDAVRLGPTDDTTTVTPARKRDAIERLVHTGHGGPGVPEMPIVMDSGHEAAHLSTHWRT
jgi:hypothetical protein